jgi:hypothetical protein
MTGTPPMITPANKPRDAGHYSPWLPYYYRDHRQPLKAAGDHLYCAVYGPTEFFADGVASFIETADELHQGKYNNRTRYAPANDGVIATLPLRLVHQGYSNRVARELPVGSNVVEIGCAAGLDWFAKRYRMIGLDLSGAAAYHERLPILANSVWHKLSLRRGQLGYTARLRKILTSGPMRIPSLAVIAAVDGAVGHILATRYARCQTTVARKT